MEGWTDIDTGVAEGDVFVDIHGRTVRLTVDYADPKDPRVCYAEDTDTDVECTSWAINNLDEAELHAVVDALIAEKEGAWDF